MRIFLKTCFILCLLPTLGMAAENWKLFKDKLDDGTPFLFVEQEGEAGNILNIVCIAGTLNIDVFIGADIPDGTEGALSFQVDQNDMRFLRGVFQRYDANDARFEATNPDGTPA